MLSAERLAGRKLAVLDQHQVGDAHRRVVGPASIAPLAELEPADLQLARHLQNPGTSASGRLHIAVCDAGPSQRGAW